MVGARGSRLPKPCCFPTQELTGHFAVQQLRKIFRTNGVFLSSGKNSHFKRGWGGWLSASVFLLSDIFCRDKLGIVWDSCWLRKPLTQWYSTWYKILFHKQNNVYEDLSKACVDSLSIYVCELSVFGLFRVTNVWEWPKFCHHPVIKISLLMKTRPWDVGRLVGEVRSYLDLHVCQKALFPILKPKFRTCPSFPSPTEASGRNEATAPLLSACKSFGSYKYLTFGVSDTEASNVITVYMSVHFHLGFLPAGGGGGPLISAKGQITTRCVVGYVEMWCGVWQWCVMAINRKWMDHHHPCQPIITWHFKITHH